MLTELDKAIEAMQKGKRVSSRHGRYKISGIVIRYDNGLRYTAELHDLKANSVIIEQLNKINIF